MTSKVSMTKDELLSSLGNPSFKTPHPSHFEPFKDDKDVALAAVSKKGNLLSLFSDRLIDDTEVVMAAVTEDPRSIRHAGEECRDDKNIARQALYNNRKQDLLYEFSSQIKNDYALIAGALPNITSAGESIRGDKALMTEIIKNEPSQFRSSTPSLMEDQEYSRLALSLEPRVVRWLPESHPLLKDRALALETVNRKPETLEFFKAFHDDAEVVHVAYKKEEWNLSEANPDKSIVLDDETILQYASDRIQTACETNDPHKVLGAMTLERKMQKSLAPKHEPRRPSIKI